MLRYADDAVIICELKDDAERIYKVLGQRFEKYGLKIHPEKTKLLDFTKPKDDQGKGSFTFLGFTFYWTKSRKGRWMVGRKTDGVRLKRAIAAITAWCKKNRHKPIKEQWEILRAKIAGHYAYYGMSLNYQSLAEFLFEVKSTWLKWLNRRSSRASFTWKSFTDFLKDWPLPRPRIIHSYC